METEARLIHSVYVYVIYVPVLLQHIKATVTQGAGDAEFAARFLRMRYAGPCAMTLNPSVTTDVGDTNCLSSSNNEI